MANLKNHSSHVPFNKGDTSQHFTTSQRKTTLNTLLQLYPIYGDILDEINSGFTSTWHG